jgi:UDP-glucose 4-epimerase
MEVKTILVTGGAGFIGSHLCERLSKRGHKVISLDNYFTGTEANHVSGVDYRRGHTKDIEAYVSEVPDVVYHLGEYSRVEQSFEDIKIVWESNKQGTFAVLEFCRQYGCKLVYAGSSTKFGDGGMGRDQSPYAWTKASNTELVRNYGQWFGLDYAITYFYNVYGPREITEGKYATLIGLFQDKLRKRQSLTVVAPGTQVRNFTHVDDIVDGLLLVGERGYGDDFGLGAEEGYSIIDIAKMFGGEIVMLPERKGNRMSATVESERAKAELGWSPKQKIVDYIKDFKQSLV